MSWRKKRQLATTVREEGLMLDFAYGGPLFEEARQELLNRARLRIGKIA